MSPNELLRLEALRLAAGTTFDNVKNDVQRAQAYYDFLTGKPAQTPREIIEAALDAAKVS